MKGREVKKIPEKSNQYAFGRSQALLEKRKKC